MYICLNCGAVMEDYKIIKDPRPFGLGVAYEEYADCPECHESDIVPAVECEHCGKYIPEYSHTGKKQTFCDDCVYEEDEEVECKRCFGEFKRSELKHGLCPECYGDLYGKQTK